MAWCPVQRTVTVAEEWVRVCSLQGLTSVHPCWGWGASGREEGLGSLQQSPESLSG